jgi:hypothetical protein
MMVSRQYRHDNDVAHNVRYGQVGGTSGYGQHFRPRNQHPNPVETGLSPVVASSRDFWRQTQSHNQSPHGLLNNEWPITNISPMSMPDTPNESSDEMLAADALILLYSEDPDDAENTYEMDMFGRIPRQLRSAAQKSVRRSTPIPTTCVPFIPDI